jgi:RNA polymerase sigma factor (sigma-70 family)
MVEVLDGWKGMSARYGLLRIARAKILANQKHRRDQRYAEASHAGDQSSDWDEFESRSVWSMDLRRAIRRLTVEDRRLLWMVGVEGRPRREIGEILGIREDTVRKRLQRLNDRLRRELGDGPGSMPDPSQWL